MFFYNYLPVYCNVSRVSRRFLYKSSPSRTATSYRLAITANEEGKKALRRVATVGHLYNEREIYYVICVPRLGTRIVRTIL